jgi:hypothetical protein
MYDKYFTATPFATNGTKLSKHKGILLANTTGAAGATATFQLFNASGVTVNAIIPTPGSSTQILPIQAYSASSMAAGLTAWLLS